MNLDKPEGNVDATGEDMEHGGVAVMESAEQDTIPEITDEMWYEGMNLTPEQLEKKSQFENACREKMRENDKENFFHIADEHIGDVKRGARRFAYVIGNHRPELLTNEVKIAIDDSAEEHDTVVDWVLDPATGKRKRLRGVADYMPKNVADVPTEQFGDGIKEGNEQKSANFGADKAREVDPDRILYTERVLALKRKGTEATYPDVIPVELTQEDLVAKDPQTGEMVDINKYFPANTEGKHIMWGFVQPANDESRPENAGDDDETRLVKLAVGTGDLDYEGEVNAYEFKQQGNKERKELSEDIREDLKKGIGNISIERKIAMVKEELKWVRDQIDFEVGGRHRHNRHLVTSSAINGAGPEVAKAIKDDLAKIYTTFDSDILAAIKRHEDAEKKYAGLTGPDIYELQPELAEALFTDLYLNEMGYTREEMAPETMHIEA